MQTKTSEIEARADADLLDLDIRVDFNASVDPAILTFGTTCWSCAAQTCSDCCTRHDVPNHCTC